MVRPNRGLLRVNLRSARIQHDADPTIQYDPYPVPTPLERTALGFAVEEFENPVGIPVPDPGQGVVPGAGAAAGRAQFPGGGVNARAGAMGITRGPGSYQRGQGGRRRQYWRRIKDHPSETVAFGAACSFGFAKVYKLAELGSYLERLKKLFNTYKGDIFEGVASAQEMAKDIGWDGVIIVLCLLFAIIRALRTQNSPAPPPPSHYAPYAGEQEMDGGGGLGGGALGSNADQVAVDDLRRRMSHFERISNEDKGDLEERKEEKSLAKRMRDLVTRARQRALNPNTVFQGILAGLKIVNNWPLPSQCQERVAPELMADGYSGGQKLYDVAVAYNIQHAMDGTHAGNSYERISAALDEMNLFDGIDTVNSAGCEILCRWAYGYRKATSGVSKVEHHKGQKAQLRTRWDLMDKYDVLPHLKSGLEAKGADQEVLGQMKEEALFSKYYSKLQEGPR
jgi:hypothetical protein